MTLHNNVVCKLLKWGRNIHFCFQFYIIILTNDDAMLLDCLWNPGFYYAIHVAIVLHFPQKNKCLIYSSKEAVSHWRTSKMALSSPKSLFADNSGNPALQKNSADELKRLRKQRDLSRYLSKTWANGQALTKPEVLLRDPHQVCWFFPNEMTCI